MSHKPRKQSRGASNSNGQQSTQYRNSRSTYPRFQQSSSSSSSSSYANDQQAANATADHQPVGSSSHAAQYSQTVTNSQSSQSLSSQSTAQPQSTASSNVSTPPPPQTSNQSPSSSASPDSAIVTTASGSDQSTALVPSALFQTFAASLCGRLVIVYTKSNGAWEGILRKVTQSCSFVLDVAAKRDEKTGLLHSDTVVNQRVFTASNVVNVALKNVDFSDFQRNDAFLTDGEISKINGQPSSSIVRELEPWDDGGNQSGIDGLEVDISLDERTENGWDAAEMFKRNEKYGLTNDFDENMPGYMVEIEKTDVETFKKQEEIAKKIASKIENNAQSHHSKLNIDNGDEEDLYAAVARPLPQQSAPVTVASNDRNEKYVTPYHRSGGYEQSSGQGNRMRGAQSISGSHNSKFTSSNSATGNKPIKSSYNSMGGSSSSNHHYIGSDGHKTVPLRSNNYRGRQSFAHSSNSGSGFQPGKYSTMGSTLSSASNRYDYANQKSFMTQAVTKHVATSATSVSTSSTIVATDAPTTEASGSTVDQTAVSVSANVVDTKSPAALAAPKEQSGAKTTADELKSVPESSPQPASDLKPVDILVSSNLNPNAKEFVFKPQSNTATTVMNEPQPIATLPTQPVMDYAKPSSPLAPPNSFLAPNMAAHPSHYQLQSMPGTAQTVLSPPQTHAHHYAHQQHSAHSHNHMYGGAGLGAPSFSSASHHLTHQHHHHHHQSTGPPPLLQATIPPPQPPPQPQQPLAPSNSQFIITAGPNGSFFISQPIFHNPQQQQQQQHQQPSPHQPQQTIIHSMTPQPQQSQQQLLGINSAAASFQHHKPQRGHKGHQNIRDQNIAVVAATGQPLLTQPPQPLMPQLIFHQAPNGQMTASHYYGMGGGQQPVALPQPQPSTTPAAAIPHHHHHHPHQHQHPHQHHHHQQQQQQQQQQPQPQPQQLRFSGLDGSPQPQIPYAYATQPIQIHGPVPAATGTSSTQPQLYHQPIMQMIPPQQPSTLSSSSPATPSLVLNHPAPTQQFQLSNVSATNANTSTPPLASTVDQ